jgi:hypothetical protein
VQIRAGDRADQMLHLHDLIESLPGQWGA